MGNTEFFNDLINSLSITAGGELIKFLEKKAKKKNGRGQPKAIRCQDYKIKGAKKTMTRGICRKDRKVIWTWCWPQSGHPRKKET
jgi:hypothetical protein